MIVIEGSTNNFLLVNDSTKYDNQLMICIENIEKSHRNKDTACTLSYIWEGLSISSVCNNESLVLKFIKYVNDYSVFLAKDSGYKYLIETLIAKKFNSVEINVTLYFVLSIIQLEQNEYMQSYYAAKLSYYYAEKLPEYAQDSYLCNAQLQLALSLIYTNQLPVLNKVIEYFEWYIENCRTTSEKVLIDTIIVMVDCINQKQSISKLLKISERLIASNVPFYPLYLLMHLKQYAKFYHPGEVNIIFENRFLQKYRELYDVTINPKLNNHLLRFENYHSDSFFYELNVQFYLSQVHKELLLLVNVKAQLEEINDLKNMLNQLERIEYFECYMSLEEEYLFLIRMKDEIEAMKVLKNKLSVNASIYVGKEPYENALLFYNNYLHTVIESV